MPKDCIVEDAGFQLVDDNGPNDATPFLPGEDHRSDYPATDLYMSLHNPPTPAPNDDNMAAADSGTEVHEL